MKDETLKNYEVIKATWKNYLTREVEILHIESYLPLTKENKYIYSPKLLDLILILGSDMENVFKIIGKIRNDKVPGNMNEYKENVFSYIKDLPSKQFELYDNSIAIENPFKDWDQDKKLDLWEIYTSLKHSSEEDSFELRDKKTFIKYGTWEYALQFLSALFLLINLTCEKLINDEEYRNQYILKPFSQIFKYKYFGTVEPMNTTFEQNGGTIIIG